MTTLAVPTTVAPPTHPNERRYYCANCGKYLFRSTVPLGTAGGIDTKCPDRRCQWLTFVLVGREPPPRVDHQVWLDAYLRFGATRDLPAR